MYRMQRRREFHGMAHTGIYGLWCGIIARCYNPGFKQFNDYGGKGIKVCPEWRSSFKAFYRDMGDPPPKHTIHRIDNDGDYSPQNCEWVTRQEQARQKKATMLVDLDGEKISLTDFCKRKGLKYTTVWQRLKRKHRKSFLEACSSQKFKTGPKTSQLCNPPNK